ncbi:MAG: HNH endonuclease signature motif containing protein [Gammaproteobacteria bacterium]|nr:HNH endonuclease signature motif containing protein [Gammaproteobacteria bacterium]MDE0413087.1 HNH endonuclease signature motif containing protein [Gammaproteobacteria bacterium]
MFRAIHNRRSIADAQDRLLRRIRLELRTEIQDVLVGYQGGHVKIPKVLANNRIWFANQVLQDESVPRYWNAFGVSPLVLRYSNHITVEVNPAMRGVNRRVAGLFAVDDETNQTVLLHRGRIGGGKKGIGKKEFVDWYRGTKVEFFDPSRDDGEESAIFVADLDSEDFLIDLEEFVDAVQRFKTFCKTGDPSRIPNTDLRMKAAAAPAKPKSKATVAVVYTRNPHVAELAKRRAGGKCELCGKPAPFTNAEGQPYLESHHIVWLAHGGLDVPDNTVALCPNCHRRMHIVNEPEDIRKLKRRAGRVLRD